MGISAPVSPVVCTPYSTTPLDSKPFAYIVQGHCRRRKIRCLSPTPEDPQGRCVNCIRLKKECVFYPVDHGPEMRDGRKDSINIPSQSGAGANAPLSPGYPGIDSLQLDSHNPPFGPTTDHPYPMPYLNDQAAKPYPAPFPSDAIAQSSSSFNPNFSLGQSDGESQWQSPGGFQGQQNNSADITRRASAFYGTGEAPPATANMAPNMSYLAQTAGSPTFQESPIVYPPSDPSRHGSFSNIDSNISTAYGLHESASQSSLSNAHAYSMGAHHTAGSGSASSISPGDGHSPVSLIPANSSGVPTVQNDMQQSWLPQTGAQNVLGGWYVDPGLASPSSMIDPNVALYQQHHSRFPTNSGP